jgi:hypothetical protein
MEWNPELIGSQQTVMLDMMIDDTPPGNLHDIVLKLVEKPGNKLVENLYLIKSIFGLGIFGRRSNCSVSQIFVLSPS